MQVSIVLITWNRKEELRNTLKYLFKYKHFFKELIVVDNGSDDGTPEMIIKEFPSICLIRLHKNTGVCEARNIGAVNAKNDLILFLDDDGYFDASTIPLLVEQFENNEKIAVIGGQVVKIAHKLLEEIDFSVFKPSVSELTKSYNFVGTMFMIRRHVFFDVGMFPDYFFYSNEENDLSLRILKKGYEIYKCNYAIMLHYASSKQRPPKRHQYYYYRNIHFQIWRNLPLIFAIKESLFVSIGGFLRALFNGGLVIYLKGTLEALARLPGIIVKEREALSLEQYKLYASLRGEDFRLKNRIYKLLYELFLSKGKQHEDCSS